MKKYYKFLRAKIYLGVLIVLGMAMLGSVLGARKESKEPLAGITREDMEVSQRAGQAPDLTGILPLAVGQNQWYNFKFAFVFGIAGAVIYCISMVIYFRLYHLRFFRMIRSFFGEEEGRNDLFFSFGKELTYYNNVGKGDMRQAHRGKTWDIRS